MGRGASWAHWAEAPELRRGTQTHGERSRGPRAGRRIGFAGQQAAISRWWPRVAGGHVSLVATCRYQLATCPQRVHPTRAPDGG